MLDASVALSWAFDDEASGAYADRVLDALTQTTAVVPSLWLLELANALVVAERRGRITPAETSHFLHLVQRLPVEVETVGLEALPEVLSLARTYGLSAYDAAYLILAMRRGLPLATLDDRLRQAAEKAGVGLYLHK